MSILSFQRESLGAKIRFAYQSRIAYLLTRWLLISRGRSCAQSLRVLERLPLGGQASLALVRFGQDKLLLGITATSVTMLVKEQLDDSKGFNRSNQAVS